jgi:hypothetical protein
LEKKLRGDFVAQKLHLLPDAEVVKGGPGQHQVIKQLGPADGELETHQTVGTNLLDADELAGDIASAFIGGGSGGCCSEGHGHGHGLAGICVMTVQGPCQKTPDLKNLDISREYP